MNKRHAELCSSEEWAQDLRDVVLPDVIGGVVLGEDVLEIGPGYGAVTDVLLRLVDTLTLVEVDPDLAADLTLRYPGVNVVCASAADLPLPTARFSSVVCCTMLHHVPTHQLQDAIFAETFRVLRAGGLLTGSDSLPNQRRQELHRGDVYNPVAADGLGERLLRQGFVDPEVTVRRGGDYFTFAAWRPGLRTSSPTEPPTRRPRPPRPDEETPSR